LTTLNRGAFSEECPFECEQLGYLGGGHPGCGSFVEALKIIVSGECRFVLQQYVDDYRGKRYRFKEFESADQVVDAMRIVWPDVRALLQCQWTDQPWWALLPFDPLNHEQSK
jgi:hypothetical protein